MSNQDPNSEGFFTKNSIHFHNYAIGISVFLGVMWGAISFYYSGSKDKAEYELLKIQEELKDATKKNKGIYASDIRIDYTIFNTKIANKKGLSLQVILKNNGNKEINFTLDNETLKVYKLNISKKGIIYTEKFSPLFYEELGNGRDKKNKHFNTIKLLPNVKKIIPYLLTVEAGSFYYVTFKSPAESIALESNNKKDKLVWFSSKYIYLE